MTGSTNERWLTYVEVGELLGCTLTAARMHAQRRGWPRHSPNMIGDRSRVLVPDDVVARQHEQRRSPSTADCYRADGSDPRLDTSPTKADWAAWERDLEARLG